MKTQLEDPAHEIKRLRRCINDLISVLALPATWIGSEPSRIVDSLLDGLLNMLNLEFAYVCLGRYPGEALEFLRASSTWDVTPQPQEVGDMVRSWQRDSAQHWPELMRKTFRHRDISILPMQLGVQGEIGLLVAGSERIDFPLQTERLVLSIAANQATVGLKEAWLLNEQKRTASQLGREVAERTEGLAAANQNLTKSEAALQGALDEIKKSEAKLRQVIDAIPTLAWCNLTDGSNEFLSKRWHEYTGLSPEESHGWGWQVAFHPDDLPPLMEKWRKMLISGESDEIEARLRRADGVYRWFLIKASPFRDETGTIVRWYGTSTDIEDRKHAEEAVVASERNLRLIINTMPALAWSAQADGNVDFVNQRWLDYAGLSPVQAQGWGWAQAFHPDDLGHLNDYWLSIIAAGQPGEIEARLRRFDGTYRWFLFRASPLRDESGRIVKWYGTNTDIDRRKRAEEELRTAQSELARVMRVMTMGQLTASIAHEVNQPLSGIITNASTCLRMLDANPPNVEGARETARRTIRDGHRASDVITRLRTLYSKKEPAVESMDLNEAAREVTALSSTEIQRNGVSLRQELADSLPPVTGDRVQLQQVILNLLRNAVDAMSTIDDRPRDLVVRTEWDGGNQVRLSVKDSGVGFTPQAADRVFEAFYTTKTDGMGIGLSISRSIIEAHQGRLWATRNDGPGSTFSFSIPCWREGMADVEARVNRAHP
jgi:PAS domain S-box-containing protein